MTVRRQLVNFGSNSTDFRVGPGALEELPRLLKNVVGAPKRALVVCDGLPDESMRRTVRRALIDSGFTVDELSLADMHPLATLAAAERLYAEFASLGLTSDDLVVAVGAVEVCSVVSFCSRTWCSGMSSVAIACTLDAMCTLATSMRALDAGGASEMVSTLPGWDMVVADIDLVLGRDVDEVGLGYVELLASALADSRRVWDQFPEKIEGMLNGDAVEFANALCSAQTARSGAIRSANPSSRNAFQYGQTTARALRKLLGPEIPWYQLRAEGLRFEARLAHDVCKFEVDTIFEIDDRLEELGVEELMFDIDAAAFVDALKAERYSRANRLMLALPRYPGAIRLCAIEEDVLERHAAAYLDSRREEE